MGELVDIRRREDRQREEARNVMVAALEGLLERARQDHLASICFVAIPRDRNSLGVGILHTPECRLHEMVGATTILNDQVRDLRRS